MEIDYEQEEIESDSSESEDDLMEISRNEFTKNSIIIIN